MATNESGFKTEFRRDLESHYRGLTEVWTSNDMFKAGIPDFNATWFAHYFSIEAKFTGTLPKRDGSLALSHPVSAGQFKHLLRIHQTGCSGVVLIGMPDIAIGIPIQKFITYGYTKEGESHASNITVHSLLALRAEGYAFTKENGHWNVGGFYEKLSEAA